MSQSVPKALEDWKTTAGTQNFFYKNVTKTDAFGNVFVAGATMNSGFPDILVAKYNSSGNLLWLQQYAGTAPNGVDFAAGMYVTDTHVYLTGAVSNNSVVPETDCITMKLASSTGSVVWSSTYSGPAGGHDGGKNITVDGAGNVFVSGLSYNSSFNSDYLALSYNSSGAQQWTSTWDYLGGDDASVKVAISGSNLNITGAVTTATASVYKLATIRLAQSTGSLLATNVSTAVTTTSVDVVCDMATDNATGDIIIVGSNNVGGQGTNIYVQKLSNTLVTNWVYTYNGSASLDDIAKGVDIDASGNVFVSGYTTSSSLGKELAVIKLNSSGINQWTQTSGFSGDDEALDLIVDANNDCYVTGYKTNSLSTNYYTAKYSSAGTKIWEVEADGNSADDDNGTNLTLDSLNNVIVTGQSKTPSGDYEFLTVKYVQKDVIIPTDFNGEVPSRNFSYYRNRGQLKNTSGSAVSDLKFYTNQTNPSFYFQGQGHSFVFAKVDTVISTTDTLHRIDVTFNKSNESGIYPLETQDNGYLNYYLSGIGSITNVKANQKMVTTNLYNNIDLIYSSNQNGIKYYFIVKPGGDMRDIDIEFSGASSFSLDGSTNALTINSSIGSLTYDRPTVYQLTTGNATVAVTGWTPDWQTNGASNKYKFNTGSYTSSLTLVIEVDQGNSNSTVNAINNLCWSTYFGGDGYDAVYGITKDNLGNQYMAGGTMSTDFPVFNGPIQGTLLGEVGAFFAQFGTFNQQIYTTYYAGCGADKKTTFWDIKCKNASEIVMAGYTTCSSLLLQSTGSAFFDNSFSGPEDGFIASFNNNGVLLWASYLGGASGSDDRIKAIDFDSNGNLYAVGVAGSGFPLTTTPSYNQSYAGTGDGFIAKFNTSYGMVWSTYFGGSDADEVSALKIDNSNRLMITGNSMSTNLPCLATGSAYADNSLGGTSDNFISVFSSNAQQLWTAYIGGSTPESYPVEGMNNICSSVNSIFIVGTTQSSNFPTSNPGGVAFFDNSLSVNTFPQYATGDGYIMEFDKTTFQQKWGTLVSGNGASLFRSAEMDANGNLFISGCTGDHTMPFTGPSGAYTSNTFNGGGLASTPSSYEDGVILSFTAASRKLNWCTLFGGYNDHPYGDDIYDMMLIGSDLYIGGMTTDKHIAATTNIPLVDQGNGNYFKNTFGGSFQDAIITKFCTATVVGINETATQNNSNEVSIYPNPAETYINIGGKNFSGEVNVVIYNASGQTVLSSVYSINSTEISQKITNLATGLYIVKVTDSQNTYTSKFIKQ